MNISAKRATSRHKCLIYSGDPANQIPIVAPLLAHGLTHNWRCLYLGDDAITRRIVQELRDRGFDIDAEKARGAISFGADQPPPPARFEPEVMVATLEGLIDQALADGFRGLCAAGDIAWELGTEANFDRLLEYEALLERLFERKPLQGICLYRSGTAPPQAFLDAMLTHRSVCDCGSTSQDNLFYLPPAVILEGGETRQRHCEWMVDQIVRVQSAEAERTEMARKLAQQQQDLERQVQDRTRELEAAYRELETFSYSIAHDLKRPLRQIDFYVAKIQREQRDQMGDGANKWLEKVCASAAEMKELIAGLLALASHSNQDLRRETVDLSRLAEAIGQQLQNEDPGRVVEFRVEPGLSVVGDATLLHALLDNLIGNAWKFTGKRDKPVIAVTGGTEQGNFRVFHVSDNGAGFASEQASRLFNVFQRLHTQSEFPGTGVGLASVKRIAQRHGGDVRAEGSPGVGATFSFLLPTC